MKVKDLVGIVFDRVRLYTRDEYLGSDTIYYGPLSDVYTSILNMDVRAIGINSSIDAYSDMLDIEVIKNENM